MNETFNLFADRVGMDAETRRTLNLVFDELLNNTISYGYEDDDDHIIELTVSLSRDRLCATISDDGKPFDPLKSDTPDTGLSVEDRPVGGLGVHLVRNMIDHVSYERRGSHNVVHLEKQLDSTEE